MAKKDKAKPAKGKTLKMKNAGEVGSVKELKKSLKRGGNGGYLKRVPADGITVRFLTEPDKWFKYFEHYDDSRKDNFYFPCTEDCPGCDEGISSSKRYLANALDVAEGKVVPMVLPASLASNLLKKYEKFKTMMDRDYDLTKDGTGFDTEYDALYDGPKKMKTDRYTLLDLESILVGLLSGDDDDDDDDDVIEEVKPKKKSKPGGKPGSKAPVPDDDDDDDDDEDDAPKKRTKTIDKSKSKGKGKALAKPAKKPLSKKK